MFLAAAIFLAAAAASVFILRPPGSRVVEVVQDDAVLYTIDLDAAEDMVFVVFYPQNVSAVTEGDDGGIAPEKQTGEVAAGVPGSNTITVQNGEIWVSAAECPDHTCMKMGKLRSARLPVVCLPNHLIIRFQE